MELIPVITLALVAVLLVLVIILLARKPVQPPKTIDSGAISALGALVTQNLREGREAQDSRLAAMDRSVSGQLDRFEKRLHGFSVETSQQLDGIRAAVDGNLRELREDNNKKLDEMRGIVDEKLQKTLSDRMNESFRLVNERLEQVYRGLGEMQTLAQGVGDLKKVLTNVKNRGIVGEIQLGAILSDILAPEQYAENVATVPGSRNVVEFAVRLPAEDGGAVWLPIDSKFPGDTYGALRDAYESGSREQIDACAKQLILTLRSEAKDIRDKYLAPPYTTEFGIMFLPFERGGGAARHGRDPPARLSCQYRRPEHDGGAAEQPSDVVSHDRHPEALGRGMERSGRGQDRVRQVRDLPDADAEPSRSGEPRAGQAGRHENARHPPPSQERHRALRGGNRARARRGGGRRADFIKN